MEVGYPRRQYLVEALLLVRRIGSSVQLLNSCLYISCLQICIPASWRAMAPRWLAGCLTKGWVGRDDKVECNAKPICRGWSGSRFVGWLGGSSRLRCGHSTGPGRLHSACRLLGKRLGTLPASHSHL